MNCNRVVRAGIASITEVAAVAAVAGIGMTLWVEVEIEVQAVRGGTRCRRRD